MTDRMVIFDKGPLGPDTGFTDPIRIIRADAPEDVPAAFEAIEAARDAGYWLAGYVSYETGYTFSSKLRDLIPENRETPLVLMGVFEAPGMAVPLDQADAAMSEPMPVWSRERYGRAFREIRAHIERGDFYQANLTFPMTARYSGSPSALYRRLREKQDVGHGAFVDLGGPQILSRSPELFFSCDNAGGLLARPMKGTAPRGPTPKEDEANRRWLAQSEKNRAENLMIVDLLRNDMSRVSRTGSVRVPELFTIETYATLHQMTSRIISQLRDGVTAAELFAALFPCGSVTGAPKIIAMQTLRRLEHGARDAYCGAIGWMSPDGAMEFNVAIRTILCSPDGSARLNVGGGIVYDSSAEDEYDEALLKASFARLSGKG